MRATHALSIELFLITVDLKYLLSPNEYSSETFPFPFVFPALAF